MSSANGQWMNWVGEKSWDTKVNKWYTYKYKFITTL